MIKIFEHYTEGLAFELGACSREVCIHGTFPAHPNTRTLLDVDFFEVGGVYRTGVVFDRYDSGVRN